VIEEPTPLRKTYARPKIHSRSSYRHGSLRARLETVRPCGTSPFAIAATVEAHWILAGGRQFVSRIRRWTGCNGRAFIGNGSLKRSMSLCATATGAANTFHSTTSEHGGVVSEPS
jgi:hypothetical protein